MAELAGGIRDARSELCRIAPHREYRVRDIRI